VVVGAGWIGSEFAASAHQRGFGGCDRRSGGAADEADLGAEIGEFLPDVHASNGVDLVLGDSVGRSPARAPSRRCEPAAGANSARLRRCGYRRRARVELADEAGLKVDNGHPRGREAPNIGTNVFAAGERRPRATPFYGRTPRLEHWSNALTRAQRSAGDARPSQRATNRIPYFFLRPYERRHGVLGLRPAVGRGGFRGDRDGRASSSPSGSKIKTVSPA